MFGMGNDKFIEGIAVLNLILDLYACSKVLNETIRQTQEITDEILCIIYFIHLHLHK